jgi:enolase
VKPIEAVHVRQILAYNQLLRIEEELGDRARYPGRETPAIAR